MSKKIKVEQLTDEILSYLENFKDVTEEACESGVKETATEGLKLLRSAHPEGSGKYQSWDEYNSGWAKRVNKQKTRLKGIQAILWNEKHYQLTHLLEKGHIIVKGPRAGERTQTFQHIAPVEEKLEGDLMKNIRKRI